MDFITDTKIDSSLHLLRMVSDLQIKYNEIIKITGEGFNIFNILKLTTKEVRTHSAFLGELLDINGSHGLSSTFLKIFLNSVHEKFNNEALHYKINSINLNDCNLIVEYYLGPIYNEGKEGGIIDILLIDKDQNALIIENKIYAGDQKFQLIRYHNAFPNAPILYLTLEGKEPSNHSCSELKINQDYYCLNYRDDIVSWLEKCKKEVVNYPLIRESITQYINLIKDLTNQSISVKMKEELLNKIVNNGDFIDAAFELSGMKSQIKAEIIRKLINHLVTQLGTEFTVEDRVQSFGKKDYSELFISNPAYWKKHSIVLTLSNDNETLELGIYKTNDQKSISVEDELLKEEVKNKLSMNNFGKLLNSDGWIWNVEYLIWNNTSWKDVAQGKIALAEDIKKIFKQLTSLGAL